MNQLTFQHASHSVEMSIPNPLSHNTNKKNHRKETHPPTGLEHWSMLKFVFGWLNHDRMRFFRFGLSNRCDHSSFNHPLQTGSIFSRTGLRPWEFHEVKNLIFLVNILLFWRDVRTLISNGGFKDLIHPHIYIYAYIDLIYMYIYIYISMSMYTGMYISRYFWTVGA